MPLLPKFILREVDIQVVASLMSEITEMENYLDSDAINELSEEELEEKISIYNRLKETLEIKKSKLNKDEMDSVEDILVDSAYFNDVDRNIERINESLKKK